MARPSTSTPANSQTDSVIKQLNALVERAPDLAEPADFYRVALPVLRKAEANVLPFTLDSETIERKLESGLPLLTGEDLPLDVMVTRAVFLQLCRLAESASPNPARQPRHPLASLFARSRPDPIQLIEQAHVGNGAALRSAAAAQIRRAVEQDELDLASLWAALATGDRQRLERTAVDLQLDAVLLRFLAENSLKPSLRVWARGLKDSLEQGRWQRGSCVMCGSPPALAEIQGKEGERRLRCSLCGADWHYPRLKCAFCDNSDHKLLGTISIEGEEEKYRAQTCDRCHGYLKVVVTFDPTPVDLLAVVDLATLHLDLIAAERGYTRVPVQ